MKVLIPSLAMMLFLAGCGFHGSDLPRSQSVNLSLTPMSATVPVGGTVDLQAQVSGFTSAPYLNWWMQEQHDAGATGSEDCDSMNAVNQNLIPTCTFGYIVVNSMDQNSSTATYHAPQKSGTFHVTFRAVQMSTEPFGGAVEKKATATIIVQ
jgi:hypothetical protein